VRLRGRMFKEEGRQDPRQANVSLPSQAHPELGLRNESAVHCCGSTYRPLPLGGLSTRSNHLQAVLESLRDLHDYWAAHTAVPVDDWQPFPGPGPEGLNGLVSLLWVDEVHDTRFLSAPAQPALDVPPSQDQWQALEALYSEVLRRKGAR
jgi:hypothetical protein